MRTIRNMLVLLALTLSGCAPSSDITMESDDIEVIATCLQHFLEADVELELSERHGGDLTNRRDIIIFDSTDTNNLDFISNPNLDAFGERYTDKGVTRELPRLPRTMKHDLRARNTTSLPIPDVQRRNRHFVVVPQRPYWMSFSETYPTAKAYVLLRLPGYNRTKSRAVVAFMCGPRHHATQALYRLKRTKGGWEIEWHDIAYYL